MENFEQQVTQIVQGYITQYLQAYAANPAENWQSKDTAIYLLTSIASRGSTQQVRNRTVLNRPCFVLTA